MILIPILILQIFLFPLTVGWLMNTSVDQRRTLELQEAASHMGSSIQQIYYSLNHTTMQAGTLTSTLEIPAFIEGYAYLGNATSRTVLDPVFESSTVLEITLTFVGLGLTATTSVTMGQNLEWTPSSFMSNSSDVCITAEKLTDGIIRLSFGS
jgi:hypothetical protein